MKNCILFANVCLLILFASGASLAQEASASPTPQGERPSISDPSCPTISVSCPSDIDVGKPLEFKATIGHLDPNRTYTWEVVGGVIAEGQGTAAIKVTIVGRQRVTATLHVNGLDAACAKTASCSTGPGRFLPPPPKFDSYGALPLNKKKARLDLFAAALKQNPGAYGYVFGYGGRRSHVGEAQKAVDLAKEYLVNKLGMNEDRIVTVNAGFQEELTVELWLVPMGSIPPVAEPTVDPTEVELIKATPKKSAKHPIRR